MKKLLYPIMGLAMLFVACKKEERVDMREEASSTTMVLSVKGNKKDNLFIHGDQGLKSSALSYTSYVNVGDTMIWELDGESNILSVEDIIIVSSECEQFFSDEIVYNESKTRCYGVVATDAFGHMKYDIKYKLKDGSVVIVDPDAEINPPTGPSKPPKK